MEQLYPHVNVLHIHQLSSQEVHLALQSAAFIFPTFPVTVSSFTQVLTLLIILLYEITPQKHLMLGTPLASVLIHHSWTQ